MTITVILLLGSLLGVTGTCTACSCLRSRELAKENSLLKGKAAGLETALKELRESYATLYREKDSLSTVALENSGLRYQVDKEKQVRAALWDKVQREAASTSNTPNGHEIQRVIEGDVVVDPIMVASPFEPSLLSETALLYLMVILVIITTGVFFIILVIHSRYWIRMLGIGNVFSSLTSSVA